VLKYSFTYVVTVIITVGLYYKLYAHGKYKRASNYVAHKVTCVAIPNSAVLGTLTSQTEYHFSNSICSKLSQINQQNKGHPRQSRATGSKIIILLQFHSPVYKRTHYQHPKHSPFVNFF
jgi:hypothetical protein